MVIRNFLFRAYQNIYLIISFNNSLIKLLPINPVAPVTKHLIPARLKIYFLNLKFLLNLIEKIICRVLKSNMHNNWY